MRRPSLLGAVKLLLPMVLVFAGLLIVLVRLLEQGNLSAPVEELLVGMKLRFEPADPARAHLLGISDGDTVRVRVADYDETRLRLQGVDAPERDQPFGRAATRCLDDILRGGALTVDVYELDKYDRLVGSLYVDGERVDVQLVERGCAWWYRRYAPFDMELLSAQRRAKEARVGLWADPNPIEPERWRHRN